MITDPKVYVGTYAKYNNGSITGEWLTISDYSDKDDFLEACKALHPDESDPEFMFQDHDGIPEGMYGESHLADELFEYAALDEGNMETVWVCRENVDCSMSIADCLDAFAGTYDSSSDYAQSTSEDGGMEIPEHLQYYIDWTSMARDWELTGDVTYVHHEGTIWVFRSL